MQGTAFRLNEAPLQRVLDILMAQETVDDEDLANAWLELGDGMVLSGNPKSGNAYEMAWSLLASSSPEALAQFNEPVLLNPKKITPLLLERRPTRAPSDADLYADMTMMVNERGRTKGVKITDGRYQLNFRDGHAHACPTPLSSCHGRGRACGQICTAKAAFHCRLRNCRKQLFSSSVPDDND